MGDSMPTVSYADVPRPQPPPPDADLQEWTAFLLALQAPACRVLGSNLYAALLEAAAEDVRANGPAWAVLEPHGTRSTDNALALRFMAAVHRLALTKTAPELAAFFPSTGGSGDREAAWPALRSALVEHRAVVTEWVGLPCQTNEVNRCAALAPGFLTIAGETGLPLRLLEIGASGGLNLRWDQYHYADAGSGRSWGDPDSPVHLGGRWDVPQELLTVRAQVANRAGCDPLPLDPVSQEGGLRLRSSVWGDQPVRFKRLRGAIEVAGRMPLEVQQARAIEWLPAQLADLPAGTATVVYHSVVLQYLDPEEREAVRRLLHDVGSSATAKAPLFWLRMEPERPLRAMSLRLTQWPGATERLLATAGAHGDPVRWRGESDEAKRHTEADQLK